MSITQLTEEFKERAETPEGSVAMIEHLTKSLFTMLEKDFPAIAKSGMECFEDKQKLLKRINTPLVVYNNKTPLEMMLIGEKEQVVETIGRIENGIIS